MSEVERRACLILRRHFKCQCRHLLYHCKAVAELTELVHEACEEETMPVDEV